MPRVTLLDGRKLYKGPNKWIVNVDGKLAANARTKKEALIDLKRLRAKYKKK
jgi:hypothetical protein